MISIKVCKLSDLTNKAIILLISCICLVCIYNLIMSGVDVFAVDLIKFCISLNLNINEEKNIINRMIASNIPISIFNCKDDIEKEFDLVDNSNGNKNNIDNINQLTSENKEKSKYDLYIDRLNEGEKSKKINLISPYLLKCEKISNAKYKIGEIIINDYTKKNLDFDEIEKSLFTEISEDCRVLIYHTHTSESYSGISNYSDSYRTEDANSNVVKVGDALKQYLNEYGIYVRHDTTAHDYPSYNGAYKSSLKTVENILNNETYDIIIDVHRDALASNSKYRPTAEINGETVAKLMFVVGTNAAGLKHDNWIENLKFAIAVQQRANEVFPGLFRDLHLSTSRYNQHTSDKTIILEVGATGNTIEEACLSMKYFAALINSMRK